MIRTAIIGYGMSAQTFHLPFLAASEAFDVVAIHSRQHDAIATRWPQVRVYASTQQMLADSGADLVIVASPSDTHFDLSRQALEAGMHVLVEKPLAVHHAQGDALEALARARGRVLCVFHNRRFDGDFLTIQSLIRDRRLGPLRVFASRFDRYRPDVRNRWREQPGEGSGIWYDLGPHLVDQALCLFGPPSAVTAHLRHLRPGSEVCDFFDVKLHYPDLEVTLGSHPYASSPTPRFELHGHLGSYIKHGLDPQESRLKRGVSPKTPGWAREDPADFGRVYLPDGAVMSVPTLEGDYARLFAGLAAAIEHGGPVPVATADAIVGLQILELAQRSHEQGQTLEFDEG